MGVPAGGPKTPFAGWRGRGAPRFQKKGNPSISPKRTAMSKRWACWTAAGSRIPRWIPQRGFEVANGSTLRGNLFFLFSMGSLFGDSFLAGAQGMWE